MDVLASASFVLQNEALTQNRLANDVNALATGLRVRSAVDDPSGYTIAQTISTKVAGLQQSVTNVQTANNLLNVADGALNSIELILQRIRSLAVEANSDINSQSDLANIQAEISQMLLEINKISSETNFNGLTLFNGQFDSGAGTTVSTPTVQVVAPPFPNSATNQIGSNVLVNGNGGGQAGTWLVPQNTNVAGYFIPALVVMSIISASNNMIDPDFGTNIGPGILIQLDAYSNSSSFGAGPQERDYAAIPINTTLPQNPTFAVGSPLSQLIIDLNLGSPNGTFSFADVGAQAAFLVSLAQPAATGHALNVNDGGDEGTTISFDLPTINTNALAISDITVMAPVVVDGFNNVIGQSSSNNLAASNAELRIDNALEQIGSIRAQVGAQVVATQQDANNDDTAILAQSDTVSNIRDADVGKTVTNFTQQQILVSVSNSVLSHLQVSSTQLAALLLNSFSGPVIG